MTPTWCKGVLLKYEAIRGKRSVLEDEVFLHHVVENREGAMLISCDSLYRLRNAQAPRPAHSSWPACAEQVDIASSGGTLEMLSSKHGNGPGEKC